MPIAASRRCRTPLEALATWDPGRPLAALWSGGVAARARWTVLGEPSGAYRFSPGPDGRGRSSWATWEGDHPPVEFTHDPLADLERVVGSRSSRRAFAGGWIGWLSYDLGRVVEPAAAGRSYPRDERGWGLIELHRCERPFVFDHAAGAWSGPGPERGAARRGRHRLGEVRSATGRAGYEAGVARGIEYIRAGDVFQVNLAHRLSGPFEGSTRGLFASLAQAAAPWYGAYLESDCAGTRRAVLSLSPELFLEVDPATREVTTRPMKGTRPGARDPGELAGSPKDQAELNMIIDLMRNDLGRVCRFGSVRVPDARAIERHGGSEAGAVWQAVGTVRGELRDGVGLARLLAAAFPAGSVTGAPKIRAMQIIDELEPLPRGPYCGAVGWFGDDGRVVLNVAIRTALVSGAPGAGGRDTISDGVLDYSVGAGIVADSDPGAEWRETLDKAGAILARR